MGLGTGLCSGATCSVRKTKLDMSQGECNLERPTSSLPSPLKSLLIATETSILILGILMSNPTWTLVESASLCAYIDILVRQMFVERLDSEWTWIFVHSLIYVHEVKINF